MSERGEQQFISERGEQQSCLREENNTVRNDCCSPLSDMIVVLLSQT
jgi:hypothetical protein